VVDGQFSYRTAPLLVARPPGTAGRQAQAMETLFAGSGRAAHRAGWAICAG
jgi:hypothetical protein